jgi:hypothetical protein
MPETPGFSIAAQQPIDGKGGATAAFPYDRVTVERFRSAFPGARRRDDLRAWLSVLHGPVRGCGRLGGDTHSEAHSPPWILDLLCCAVQIAR